MSAPVPGGLKKCLGIAVVIALTGIFLSGPALSAERRDGLVSWVIDGDTFEVRSGERVRLIGVNAPEYTPWKNRVEPHGKEALFFARRLLKGQKVYLETDIRPKDRYGRTLAYVYLDDGTFVNRRLVEEGYATAKFYPPNGRHRQVLEEAQKRAHLDKKGIWKK